MNINEYLAPAGEKPLDRMVTDGGFCSIFRTIGCVGDSLSSGEFEATGPAGETLYLDMFEYSWGVGSLTITMLFFAWKTMICEEK